MFGFGFNKLRSRSAPVSLSSQVLWYEIASQDNLITDCTLEMVFIWLFDLLLTMNLSAFAPTTVSGKGDYIMINPFL